MKFWNDLRGWAGANAAALRLCFRMTVAGLLAYVLAEFFALPQGYWAVFSAIIVMQASVGGSIKATIDRVIGTIGGAVAGGAVGYIVPHQSVFSLGVALVIALAPLTLVAALWPNYRIAPLTAVIVLLTPGAQQLGPVDLAIFRIVEITLGSFVGLGVSLVLWPARAHGLVISTAARALGLLADLLGDWLAVLAGGRDRTRITQLQDDIRAAMGRLEIGGGGAEFRSRTLRNHSPGYPTSGIPQCVLIARWTSRSTSNGRQGFGMNLASPGNSGGKEPDVTTTSICGNRSFASAARAAPLILPANFSSVNKKHTDLPMRSKTETAASALAHSKTSISDSSRSIESSARWLSSPWTTSARG